MQPRIPFPSSFTAWDFPKIVFLRLAVFGIAHTIMDIFLPPLPSKPQMSRFDKHMDVACQRRDSNIVTLENEVRL